MAGSNTAVVKNAFRAFNKEMDDAILPEVELYAHNLILQAVGFRKKAPGAHDFTGNLLSSIVCAVYHNKVFKKAFFASDMGVRQPRMYQMTASHGRYIFKIDYSGDKWSKYTPEIEAAHLKGRDLAEDFLTFYNPKMKDFVVVLAYTADYADWVETQRETTGYLNTFKYANKLGIEMFQLPAAA